MPPVRPASARILTTAARRAIECDAGGCDGEFPRSVGGSLLPSLPVQLWLEIEGEPGRLELPGQGSQLIAFMSFAVSRGFGAQHPLIALADRLYEQYRVRMGPLTTFYEAEAEDAEDMEKLDLAWQDAPPLREELLKMGEAIPGDELCVTFLRRANSPGLVAEAEALAGLLERPATEGKRVRLVYAL